MANSGFAVWWLRLVEGQDATASGFRGFVFLQGCFLLYEKVLGHSLAQAVLGDHV